MFVVFHSQGTMCVSTHVDGRILKANQTLFWSIWQLLSNSKVARFGHVIVFSLYLCSTIAIIKSMFFFPGETFDMQLPNRNFRYRYFVKLQVWGKEAAYA